MSAKRQLGPVVAFCVAVLLSAVMSACTPYKPLGLMGGVDDLQLSDTTYRIYARGNGYTSSERIHDFVLLRASEIAISRGYSGFVITSETDETETYQHTTPGQETTHTTILPGVGGMPAIATTRTTYQPPTTSTTTKPGRAIEIRLVQSGGFDAQMINASLAPRYGATPSTAAVPAGAPQTSSSPTAVAVPEATTATTAADAPAQRFCTGEEEKQAYVARVTGTASHLDCKPRE